ncbi:peptidylprolyl isomerase [Novosphingobium aquiterrae]|uniref:peptidylprolyl isomerase n=1 Tax=Novosphingobium aquiterrae TaxID=624388 RepID=A0ABV6PL44_9SPHN
MNRRFALLALAAFVLTATAADAAKPRAKARPAPAAPAPLPDTVRVAMVTALGTIELDLDHKRAPITVENFVRYVDARKFDGMPFYRAMRLNWGTQPNGLIQAGLQANPLKVFKPIAHEPTSQTGILHKAGAISMARYAPGTAMADFSILLSDLPSLDADPKSTNPETQAGFAAFGHVVSGMDVVKKIWDAPLSPTKGEGPLKGQMLEPPIKVLTVRRVATAQN